MTAETPGPVPTVAPSARLVGHVRLGHGAGVAQGAVVRAHGGAVGIGAGSAVLENSVVVGWPEHPVEIGRRSVFGHRCVVLGASVGDLCEVGNGSVILAGARLGDRCFLGEGTLIPPGTVLPDGAVVVGRPGRTIRTATDDDMARLAGLRDDDLSLPDHTHVSLPPTAAAGVHMGNLYAYRDRRPQVHPSATLFDSCELTGDVTVGEGTVIGAGVRIIGDSHGPVRIGARVQILENTVLHLLPDNELVVDDDVTIGPGAMVHGCHLGAGTVVEAAATVCDWSELGAGCLVRAGAVVKQRSRFGPLAVLDGFPATQVDTLDAPPPRPPWALDPAHLETLVRVER